MWLDDEDLLYVRWVAHNCESSCELFVSLKAFFFCSESVEFLCFEVSEWKEKGFCWLPNERLNTILIFYEIKWWQAETSDERRKVFHHRKSTNNKLLDFQRGIPAPHIHLIQNAFCHSAADTRKHDWMCTGKTLTWKSFNWQCGKWISFEFDEKLK